MSSDTSRLDGRTIMVSGAAGGIGRHLVQVLVEAGARVSVCDLTAPADLPDDAVSVCGSLADRDVASRWVRATVEECETIDGLVNVAGLWRSAPFPDVTSDELAEVMAANFTTMWNACQAIIPSLVSDGRGSVVNFSSTAGQFGSIRPAAHYAAAKGAVIAFTKSLAREVSPAGVRVNAIAPGPVDTSAAGSGVDFDDAEVKNRTLLRRAGSPREIADAVRFLLSDASSYMTGSVLNVNGGSLL